MGTITLTTTRSGSGPSATIKITTTDSSGLSFVAGPVSATAETELAASSKPSWMKSPDKCCRSKENIMKPHKVSDAKSTTKQATYNRVPGRDYHTASSEAGRDRERRR